LRRMKCAASVAIILAVGAQCLGCWSPETRHRVMSFLFDGVPPPAVAIPIEQSGTEPALEETPQLSVHGPVAQRKCDLCHESQYSHRLKMDKSKLCRTCHTPDRFEGPVVHGPVASGLCYGCHDAHRSRFPFLLLEDRSTICGRCHNPETIDQHRAEKGDDCLSCHTPHVAEKEYLLK
jgi:predicted CXXCH cytochrome family protein